MLRIQCSDLKCVFYCSSCLNLCRKKSPCVPVSPSSFWIFLSWDVTFQVGIKAWKGARDSAGLTPNDYACLRGYYSYSRLVQKKIDQKLGNGHVLLDIPCALLQCGNIKQKPVAEVANFHTEKTGMKPIQQQHCRLCEQKMLSYGSSNTTRTSVAIYRPAMLSMVAIAAVCVCVALLFKSSPEVLYIFRPFRWELLKYGPS